MRIGIIACGSLFLGSAVLLGGCASERSSLPLPSADVNSLARPRPILFSFNGSDGAQPLALVNVSGTLYGTTGTGGARGKCDNSEGCGVVYRISPTGSEATVYEFTGVPDGAQPVGPLIDVDGTLYGTTAYGGATGAKECGSLGCGTVFSVTPSGKETVLHSFAHSDGSRPSGGLTAVGQTLYGTTPVGGTHNDGTFFSMTMGGQLTVLYNFGDKSSDASESLAPLVYLNGTLYGTSVVGGAGTKCDSGDEIGCGTVFGVTTSGKETVLHSFDGPPDGAGPYGGLIAVDGMLYGTTQYGGTGYTTFCYGPSGDRGGTVYNITTAGKEGVLYDFGGVVHDGQIPGTTWSTSKGRYMA